MKEKVKFTFYLHIIKTVFGSVKFKQYCIDIKTVFIFGSMRMYN